MKQIQPNKPNLWRRFLGFLRSIDDSLPTVSPAFDISKGPGLKILVHGNVVTINTSSQKPASKEN